MSELESIIQKNTFTVNTHRGNVIQKSGKAHISDVIYDVKERGLI